MTDKETIDVLTKTISGQIKIDDATESLELDSYGVQALTKMRSFLDRIKSLTGKSRDGGWDVKKTLALVLRWDSERIENALKS